MGAFLTTDSVLQCEHGGTVTVETTNTVAQADGAYILLATDVFTIAGCALASSSLPPCTTIVWDMPTEFNTVMGLPVLAEDSQGLCMGSAAPAPPVVVDVQSKVSGD